MSQETEKATPATDSGDHTALTASTDEQSAGESQQAVDTDESQEPGERLAWLCYVLPMVLFTSLGLVEGIKGVSYVWVYVAKVLVVSASLLYFRGALRDYRLEPRVLLPGILVGLAVFAEWVWIDPNFKLFGVLPVQMEAGKRVGFDPTGLSSGMFGLFVSFRLFGLAVMVPLMEELFWRSFLIRFITTEKFRSIPPYAFSWTAFAAVAGGFSLSHPEWFAALICAIAYGLLLRQTKSLFAALIAHSVTNLALGIYILNSHLWRFW